ILELPEKTTRDPDTFASALHEYANASGAQLHRALAGLILIEGEHSWRDDLKREHRRILLTHGYEPAAIERKQFEKLDTPTEEQPELDADSPDGEPIDLETSEQGAQP